MSDLRNMFHSDLKNLAKERILRGYSNLRKVELIRFLETRPTLIDERIPEINVPVLKPEKVKERPQNAEKVVEESIATVNDWLDWLSKAKIEIKKDPKVEKLKQKDK